MRFCVIKLYIHTKNNNKKKKEAEIAQLGKSAKEEMSDDEEMNDKNDNESNQKKKDVANDGTILNTDDLTKLFQQTSTFSINSVTKNNNAMFYDKPVLDSDGFLIDIEEREFNDDFATYADFDVSGDSEFKLYFCKI